MGEIFFVGPPGSLVEVLTIITAAYSAGAHADGRRAVAGLALALAGVVGMSIAVNPYDVVFPVVFFVITPWMVGRVLRNNLLVARELAERAEHATHAREEQERRAIALERGRIARELHDVLAHNLSVIVVQAGAARRIAEREPERAIEVAELIRNTGREALAELRHLFGPVRRGEGEPLSGRPGMHALDGLVARARAAGLRVELRREGDPVALPAGVDLTAYRVVQEALTNALKHAGAARATVRVSYEPDALRLSIEDDGDDDPGAAERAGLGGGHGLAGMRERVELYGGSLDAGPRGEGGFSVSARLPAGPAPRSATLTGSEALT